MNNVYTTKDIGEVATLLTKGFPLQDISWDRGIAYFSFAPKDEAEKIANQYNFGGVEVSAKGFYDNLITVKRKILEHNREERYKNVRGQR